MRVYLLSAIIAALSSLPGTGSANAVQLEPREAQQQTRPAGPTLRAVADGDFAAVVRAILSAAGRTDEDIGVHPLAREPTAAAYYSNGRKLVGYNPAFLVRISQAAETNWAVVFLFAHETAHHLKDHTIPRPARPVNERMELEANEVAGFVLARLGVPLGETLRAAAAACDLAPTAGKATPEICERAVERGWRAGSISADTWRHRAGSNIKSRR